MKYLLCWMAAFASFLVLNPMRCEAARAQEDETRALEIEESAKDAEKAGDLEGKASVRLRLATEDGQKPGKLVARTNVNYGPNRISSESGSKRLRGLANEYDLLVRAGQLDLCVTAEGYVPEFAAKGKPVFPGDKLEFDVTLRRGIPSQMKVVDEKGQPVPGAGVEHFVKFLNLSGSSSSSYGVKSQADALGVVEFNLPKDTERIYLNVFKSGYASATIEQPVAGESIEVKLIKSPVTSATVLDHEGRPLAGEAVYHIGSSQRKGPSGNISEREYVTRCAESQSEGRFETDALRKGRFHTLVVETETQRGVFSGIVAGNSVELKLPPPRKLTVRFLGNREALDPDNILLSQQFRGSAEDNWSSANIWIPHDYNEDTGVLTANGILDASVAVSAGELGTLYSVAELEDDVDEVSINLKSMERVPRMVKIVFEYDGKVVRPRGQLSFRDRTVEADGVHLDAARRASVKEGAVNLRTEASAVLLESTGLVGFALKQGEEVVELGDVKESGTYTATVEVEPAGAIHGVVLDSSGNPVATDVRCSFTFSDPSRSLSSFATSIRVVSNKEGKFVLTPIPFGAEAGVQAGMFPNKSKLQKFVVDEENPRFEANFQLPPPKSGNPRQKQ